MTPEEILQGLYDETLVGNGPRVLELTEDDLPGRRAEDGVERLAHQAGTFERFSSRRLFARFTVADASAA